MPDLLVFLGAGALAPALVVLLALGAGFMGAFIWRRSQDFALAAALAASTALLIGVALRPAVAARTDDGRALLVVGAVDAGTADQARRPLER